MCLINFSPKITQKKEKSKRPNTVLYSFRDEKTGGRGVSEIDLNDNNLDPKIKEKALLQKEIRKQSMTSYENDPEYKKLIDDIMNNISKK